MFRLLFSLQLLVLIVKGDLSLQSWIKRKATLKPLSACCDIPELGDSKPLEECSNPKLPGPCDDLRCIFQKSGFLLDDNNLNKEAYRTHLQKWAEKNKGWDKAIKKAIQHCVDKDPRQHLDFPCKAYDVFSCTGTAMLKNCPDEIWEC